MQAASVIHVRIHSSSPSQSRRWPQMHRPACLSTSHTRGHACTNSLLHHHLIRQSHTVTLKALKWLSAAEASCFMWFIVQGPNEWTIDRLIVQGPNWLTVQGFSCQQLRHVGIYWGPRHMWVVHFAWEQLWLDALSVWQRLSSYCAWTMKL